MTTEINKSQFVFSHGRQPRGGEAGTQWGFGLTRNPDITQVFWATGTWGEVVKKARAYGREHGVAVMYLLP